MKLTEVSSNEPLVITLLLQLLQRKEEVYLPLGSLKYSLVKIVSGPATFADTFRTTVQWPPARDFVWTLLFCRLVKGSAIGTVTKRIITHDTAHEWDLKKQLGENGSVSWEMTKIDNNRQ